MQQYARRRSNLTSLLIAASILASAAVASLSITQLAGTKTGFALAIAAIAGPIMVYAAVVAPLVFPFGLYVLAVPFDNILNLTAFGTLTKLLAIVSGAAIILYLVRTRRALPPPTSLLTWGALYTWAAVTAFWAIDPKEVFTALVTSIELVILYGAVSILPAERGTIRWVSIATIGGAVIAGAYGAYLFHNGIDLYYATGRLRITTETGAIDPNHFAAALLLPFCLCLANMLYARKWGVFLLNFSAMSVLLIGVAISQSRGAILAIAAIIVYFFVRTRLKVRLSLLVGGIVAAMLAYGSQTSLWDRFTQAFSTGGAGRTSIWRVGVIAFKSHWLLGAGYNNFPNAYDQAFLQTPNQMWAMATWHRASHNLLVGTAVELGIVGLALLLVAWFTQFRTLRNIPRGDELYPMRVALEAAVIGTFIAALFLDVMIFKYVWLTFMLIALVRNAYYVRRPLYA
jgi:putative inorganic carbon (HCO3(-)) transporter